MLRWHITLIYSRLLELGVRLTARERRTQETRNQTRKHIGNILEVVFDSLQAWDWEEAWSYDTGEWLRCESAHAFLSCRNFRPVGSVLLKSYRDLRHALVSRSTLVSYSNPKASNDHIFLRSVHSLVYPQTQGESDQKPVATSQRPEHHHSCRRYLPREPDRIDKAKRTN